ncbi:MAG TPA: low molecular weight protein-tyrosine-phosphatase [Candidatus Nanopelagicales bacterium]
MVCTGNICRSPMAAAILERTLADSELAGQVAVDSAAMHAYHLGERSDPRARTALAEAGYTCTHRAQLFEARSFAECDLILAMDRGHLRELRTLAAREGASSEHVMLLRDFDPQGPGDVPDPYYDTIAEFREVRAMVERTMPDLVQHLRRMLASG